MGTALSTGLFSAGLPGLGLDVSAAMEDSLKSKEQSSIQEMEAGEQVNVVTQGKRKANGKSVGASIRLLR